jgi:ATP-dependent protease ClpP protease subunit
LRAGRRLLLHAWLHTRRRRFQPATAAPPILRLSIGHKMSDEHAWGVGKRWWANYHKWRTPPAERSLEVAGHIGDRIANNTIAFLQQDPLAPVFAAIDSPGGDPFEAMRCYRALRAHKAPVHCHVASHCSSAATLILAGGDRRTSSPIAWFLLHNAEYALPHVGRHTAAVMRADAEGLDEVDEEMIAILSLRCGHYPVWQLRAEMRGEISLDANQARLRGLLTECPS